MTLLGCLLPNGDIDMFKMSRLCSLLEFPTGEIGATDLEVVPNACLSFTMLEYLVLRNRLGSGLLKVSRLTSRTTESW